MPISGSYDTYHLIRLLTQQLDDLLDPNEKPPYDKDNPDLNINFSSLVAKGSALISVDLPHLNITLRDTKLLLPGSLANLAKSMGIPEEKGIFPYGLPQLWPHTTGVYDVHPIEYYFYGLPPEEFYLSKSDDEKKV